MRACRRFEDQGTLKGKMGLSTGTIEDIYQMKFFTMIIRCLSVLLQKKIFELYIFLDKK